MGYTPHVLVVGGGATGTATARDLAMRGLEVTLVERDNLTAGATGQMQRLLYSGARYADADPETARQCYAENQRLRHIASHCVDETGGLIVKHAEDPEDYYENTLEACSQLDIPVEEVPSEDLEELEGELSSDIEAAFEVPSAVVDPLGLTVANARSAHEYGARILTKTEVRDIGVEDGAINGVTLYTEGVGTDTVRADYVINAAGPWAGKIAEMAGFDIPMQYAAGATVEMDESPTDQVLIRARPPGAGEVVVPADGRCVLGTTHRAIDSPDVDIESADETDALLDELSEIVPSLRNGHALGSHWGIWSHLGDAAVSGNYPGEFAVHDHEAEDDTWGMSTVIGGTLTTHRRIAEQVADHVCRKFGIDRPCHTADNPLPGSRSEPSLEVAMETFDLDARTLEASLDRLGDRAGTVLDRDGPNPVICECQRVTLAEVKDALDDETGTRTDLDTVRIRTGAGMGTCQGGRCAHRIASPLYLDESIERIDQAVDEFYQGRWESQRHALWGENLTQAMENYALHATTMNRDTPSGNFRLEDFDSGPEWDEDELDPYGGFAP